MYVTSLKWKEKKWMRMAALSCKMSVEAAKTAKCPWTMSYNECRMVYIIQGFASQVLFLCDYVTERIQNVTATVTLL